MQRQRHEMIVNLSIAKLEAADELYSSFFCSRHCSEICGIRCGSVGAECLFFLICDMIIGSIMFSSPTEKNKQAVLG